MSFVQLPLFAPGKTGSKAIDRTLPVLQGRLAPKNGAKVTLKRAKAKGADLRGCQNCPSNQIPGVYKIMAHIRGRSILLVAQSPGLEENNNTPPKELVGPSGRWLWSELKKVGITRLDVDIFNAVRCFPADWIEGSYNSYLKMRSPSKEEIHCCSLHTENDLKKSQAKQILIFGQLAAKQVLRTKALPAQKTFYNEELGARVYLLDHPSFFIRGGGAGARLKSFRDMLRRVAADRKDSSTSKKSVLSDEYSYIRSMDYKLVLNKKEATEAAIYIRACAAKGWFTSTDIESDSFEDGYHTFACGFCAEKGKTYVFVFRHAKQKKSDGDETFAVAKDLLEDSSIPKTFQYGCSDVETLKLDNVIVRGYRHDTNLSEYLCYSDDKAYGLDAIAERKYPDFSGYKLIRTAEPIAAARVKWQKENQDKALPKVLQLGTSLQAQDKWMEQNGELHLKYLSLDNLRLYNGGDCDIAKRIELANRKRLPESLVKLYIDLNFLLRKMEPVGPLFDYSQADKLDLIYPVQEQKMRAKLQAMLKNPNYNPGSHAQVKVAIYKTLKLEFPFEGKPNTRKGTLLMMSREHKFPGMQLEWRTVAKAGSITAGYRKCADANEGRLRTRWWGTGTRTGRLSSGGSRDKNAKVVNLQNIKKDAQVQNMCVADTRWRRVYLAFKRMVALYGRDLLRYWRVCSDEEKLAKKEKRKAVFPEMTAKVIAITNRIKQKMENWVRQKMPDLKTYLLFDYGQMEVRTAAQMANDKNLIKDCQASDIHTTVGVTMTGWDADRIKNDEAVRTLTKNVHFGILFGIAKKNLFKFVVAMSPPDMRGRITEEQISDAYDKYFERYYGIAAFIVNQREYAKEHGYVKTLFGMYQLLNMMDSDRNEEDIEELLPDDEDLGRGGYWGTRAVNGPVQGSAHQVMICGLVNLIRKPKKYKILGIPPMEVHDALDFVVNVLDLPEAYMSGKYLLEKESLATIASDFPDVKWKVPIVVEAKAGIRLGTKVKVDEKTSIGDFLLSWYKVCRQQEMAIDRLLQEAAT